MDTSLDRFAAVAARCEALVRDLGAAFVAGDMATGAVLANQLSEIGRVLGHEAQALQSIPAWRDQPRTALSAAIQQSMRADVGHVPGFLSVQVVPAPKAKATTPKPKPAPVRRRKGRK